MKVWENYLMSIYDLQTLTSSLPATFNTLRTFRLIWATSTFPWQVVIATTSTFGQFKAISMAWVSSSPASVSMMICFIAILRKMAEKIEVVKMTSTGFLNLCIVISEGDATWRRICLASGKVGNLSWGVGFQGELAKEMKWNGMDQR